MVTLEVLSVSFGEEAGSGTVCAVLSNVLFGPTTFPIEVTFMFSDNTTTGEWIYVPYIHLNSQEDVQELTKHTLAPLSLLHVVHMNA